MMKYIRIFLTAVCFTAITAVLAYSHCQIPCGIYDDRMRIDMLEEDITTIEKSMTVIGELSSAENKDYNQIVRWVNNKDEHADKISETVTYYFMAQRVAPVAESEEGYGLYAKKIILLHEIMVSAMKSKQSLDISLIEKMRAAIHGFEELYFEAE